ncbi:response regulator [Tenacibaculum sp. HL-MS23]|uniref:response regulator n=1 Tax=unclassified Tenacibaculum TaxID=2635139 RepID=UPI001C4FFAB2|nr:MULTISPECIES: response regulator [unclassified Tenacibaculum]QXP73688.1 response regulator [Tenacibaculum sp. AHE14PA]QXP75945.1 response regulator [Tenacibaculum sp. AHE15PA]WNW02506.1 response regulator [Tenacibaculum sp. HL-MS23]
MKVLAIDDQKLVLIPLENRLKKLGYEVITESNALKGIALYNSFQPDLVIVDINMPLVSGMEVVKHVRKVKKSSTPIMILSGNTDDQIITEGFELGINDYMKKPLSLSEVCARVKRLIGVPETTNKAVKYDRVIIQQRCVGVVIPCYNEEKRLLSKEFTNFIDKNSGYHLCFVNDGSKDKTLEVLNRLRKGREDFITVYNCEKNGGKAEAVRQGMLYMAKQEDLDYIGFLDADLSTDLTDFDDLVSTIENSEYKIVSGSRMSRMGANITKESARKIISLTINFVIRKILSMDFNDTQCGAKIFKKDIIEISFGKKFITQWIFDVEIFRRITLHFGLKRAKEILCEQPLKRWIHADGSKLSMKDSVKIIGQLGKIAWFYNKTKSNKNNSVTKTSIKLNQSLSQV